MLKELVDLWKTRGIMIKAVDMFGAMLADTAYIFHQSWDVFTGKLSIEDNKEKIYARDRQVNQKEREIRKLLVEHLTINPSNDASGCLALMSMVKDAERIGDYCKNILDLVVIAKDQKDLLKFKDRFTALQEQIGKSLDSLKEAFLSSDEKLAKEIVDRYQSTKGECNAIIQEVFTTDLSKQEALVTILLARYFKRINSHTSNVASGIIQPLDQIDFVRGTLLD